MMSFNILTWCDEKISYLKAQGIQFNKGIPQLPEGFVYQGKPKALSTFRYRGDVPTASKSDALITFYMFEEDLWPRLYKIDHDIKILKEYGGIVGFDLSPSVLMLRPRQKLSILINAIHSCYCGTKGIRVLPNYRAGDLETTFDANFFPDDCSFMVSSLGCARNAFKEYGKYQLDCLLLHKRPEVLFFYGSLSDPEAARLIKRNGFEIVSFPDRRNRVWNHRKSYCYRLADNDVCKSAYVDVTKGGDAWA